MKRQRETSEYDREDKENRHPIDGRFAYLCKREEIDSQWEKIRFPSLHKRNPKDISLIPYLNSLHGVIKKVYEEKHNAEVGKQWAAEFCDRLLPHPDKESFPGPALASTFSISLWNAILREIQRLTTTLENAVKEYVLLSNE
eukprot:gb/GECG01008434.1/.p1 GENE.gb/GECG01008434.1/~~gb/GECG01008434.1/.p1  ORF type:complete len:142 (+),score=17.45 gb/GECG01008434.1/:1-426(+)